MKNPDPNADGSTSPDQAEAEADDPQAQQVDLDDADVSAEPSQLPPGLPPLPLFSSRLRLRWRHHCRRRLRPAALTTRTPTRATAPSASAAPKVITIRTIEMDDNPDSGP
jgi:hypothetical protein